MPEIFEIIAKEPKFRLTQIHRAWFDLKIHGYDEITTLPRDLRLKLADFPWLSVKEKIMLESKIDGTRKALLELQDGQTIETVLMGRESKKEGDKDGVRYTVCISSQVGCPMGCAFCATGQLGFSRNLSYLEIIDQVRFWQQFLCHCEERSANKRGATRQSQGDCFAPLAMTKNNIDNIVLMGQGEPFLNYENVKEALNIILKNTEIGPSKITISTVGIPAMLDKMLGDKDFPGVRFALSLHTALEESRIKIIPSHQKGFLEFLVDWSKRYHERFSSRAHFIGLEYTMLDEINDDEKHLKALIKLAAKMGLVRVNLIPYNCTTEFLTGSSVEKIEHWHDALMKAGFTCTIRRSQGTDIAAACGQLKNQSLGG